jgi:hypothetical protein
MRLPRCCSTASTGMPMRSSGSMAIWPSLGG